MDAFSRYNQIKMDKADQEKTSFITSQGLFCYKVMLFGLKNAGATYQRLVNHMFRPQIGRNVEVYVDDMFVTNEALYKRGFSQTYLRCLTPNESYYILRDVHEGACGNHSGA